VIDTSSLLLDQIPICAFRTAPLPLLHISPHLSLKGATQATGDAGLVTAWRCPWPLIATCR